MLRRWRRLPGGYSWGAVAVELGIVVAGILAAFALNSWWEGRADLVREREHLEALRGDFRENLRLLDRQLRTEETTIAATEALLELIRDGGTLPLDSARRLLADVFSSARYQPVMGAYGAVVNTGGLTQLRDDSVRTMLAAFAAELENDYEQWLADRLYMAFIDEYSVPHAILDDGGLRATLREPGFLQHLLLRSGVERDMERRYRRLRARARAILERIGGLPVGEG